MKIDIRLGSKKKKINQDYNNFIVQNISRNKQEICLKNIVSLKKIDIKMYLILSRLRNEISFVIIF